MKFELFNDWSNITMLSYFREASEITWREKTYRVSAELKQMLLLATIITVIYWIIGLLIPEETLSSKWGDQRVVFLQGLKGLISPYEVQGFVNPPWAFVFLLPFSIPPTEIGVLLQGILYHCILVSIAFKYAPPHFDSQTKRIAGLAMISSVFFVDFIVELNIDWIPALGLLVPPIISPIFILAKPQDAIGYFVSFPWKKLIRAILVGSVTLVLSFIIWGYDWLLKIKVSLESDPLEGLSFNAAPSQFIGYIPSILVGLAIASFVFFRAQQTNSDDNKAQQKLALPAIVSGIFFVPYLPLYSMAIVYALLAARVPRIIIACNIILWIAAIILLSPILF